MSRINLRWGLILGILPLVAGCQPRPSDNPPAAAAPDLVGQRRAIVQFSGGAFAAVHDLEFMDAFNAGGTMTESSNYDGVPPVPSATASGGRDGRGDSS